MGEGRLTDLKTQDEMVQKLERQREESGRTVTWWKVSVTKRNNAQDCVVS